MDAAEVAESHRMVEQSRTTHASWGPGVVMRYEGDRIVVLFEEVGYRTLSREAVSAHGLLQAAS